MLTSLIDRALDFSVVGGYTRVGYAVRRPTFDPLPRMEDRTVLVTGATSGIGRAAALGFAGLGARVLILARDTQKGRRTVAEISAASDNERVAMIRGDLASQKSVRDAVDEISGQGPLHVLVNNAGVMALERELSPDGVELTFATNVLGTFALTQGLLDTLSAASSKAEPSRVITVGSGGMYTQALDVDDLETARREYDPSGAYARSKRAQVVLTQEWGRRWTGLGVVAHAMHPGWADTPGVATSLPTFGKVMGPLLRTPAEGADTIVWLGAADEPAQSTGQFWHDRQVRPVDRLARTRVPDADAQTLWEVCSRMTA